MSYTYNPKKITETGKDRMRFELGDVMVEGGAETCALADEEYDAVLSKYKGDGKWKKAKLEIVKAILFRFSYEVDTKVGPLNLSLSNRYNHWKAIYDELKGEVGNTHSPVGNTQTLQTNGYFHTGMHDNNSNSRGGARGVHKTGQS